MLLVAVIATGGPAAAQERCDSACLQDKVDRHLLLMGEFDNEAALTASLRDLIASGAPVLRTVEDTYAKWSRVEVTEPDGSARPGEMRWRVVYLLGSLGMRDAVRPLYEIAKAELPDPRLDEQTFADELRIQLRAVAGLESLGAIDELRGLYRAGGLLRNATPFRPRRERRQRAPDRRPDRARRGEDRADEFQPRCRTACAPGNAADR